MGIDRYPNKLKRYRRIAGHSQKKVARALGFADTSVISRWEHGALLPNLQQAFKLSQLYDVLPHLLFERLWNDVSLSLVDYKKQTSTQEEMYL
jgi:transcriptional regulator with XRE-family HTH domain